MQLPIDVTLGFFLQSDVISEQLTSFFLVLFVCNLPTEGIKQEPRKRENYAEADNKKQIIDTPIANPFSYLSLFL